MNWWGLFCALILGIIIGTWAQEYLTYKAYKSRKSIISRWKNKPL